MNENILKGADYKELGVGLSGTACNPPLFQHNYEEINARLPAIPL
jgi:hypothetical protein